MLATKALSISLLGLLLGAAGQAQNSPATAPAATLGAEQRLLLDRPLQAGDRHRIRAQARVEESYDIAVTLLAGQAPIAYDHDRIFTVDFDAVREVLETDAMGRPTRESYTVSRCVRTSKYGTAKEMVEPGAVVLAARGLDGALRVTRAAGTLSRKARGTLETVLDLPFDHGTDDIFATAGSHHVGESWPLDLSALADDLMRSGIGASPDKMTGNVTLVEQRQQEGIPAFELRAQFKAQNVALPGAISTDGQGAVLRASFSGVFPLDPALQPLRQRVETEVQGGSSSGDEASGVTTGVGMKRKVILSQSLTAVDSSRPH